MSSPTYKSALIVGAGAGLSASLASARTRGPFVDLVPDDVQRALLFTGASASVKGYAMLDAIALTYLNVLRQPRSAWTWEVELRPWVERF